MWEVQNRSSSGKSNAWVWKQVSLCLEEQKGYQHDPRISEAGADRGATVSYNRPSLLSLPGEGRPLQLCRASEDEERGVSRLLANSTRRPCCAPNRRLSEGPRSGELGVTGLHGCPAQCRGLALPLHGLYSVGHTVNDTFSSSHFRAVSLCSWLSPGWILSTSVSCEKS